MEILLVSGSPRKNANSKKVIRFADAFLEKKGIEIETFDLCTDRLPLMDGEADTHAHVEVMRLRKLAHQADGFFICTPEYHSGISGSLKNALDFLGQEHFNQKPVAIAAASGGGKGGMNALNNLRIVMRGVSALVTTNQIILDPADLTETGMVADKRERLEALLNELILLTKKMHD